MVNAHVVAGLTHAQKMAVLDASDAALRLLAAKRTLGRMQLYVAIRELVDHAVKGAA